MSVAVMQWVWQHSRSQNAGRLVLLAIADCCNSDDGTGAWPSNAELASKTRLSSRAVQVAVKALEKDGELKVDWGGGRGGVNRYMVVMSVLNPAGSAPFRETPQDLHPAGSAVPHPEEAPQPNGGTPAGSAPFGADGNPAESAPNPADSAHGTVKNRKTTTSTTGETAKRKASSTRGTRLPDDWWPGDELIAWAKKNTPSVGISTTEAFKDWFKAAPGGKGIKLDWDATYRNWMRREQKELDLRNSRASSRQSDRSTPGAGRNWTGSDDPKRDYPEDFFA